MARTSPELASSNDQNARKIDLELLLNQISEGVLLLKHDGVCLYANQQAVEMLKQPSNDALIGLPIRDVIPAFDRRWLELMQEAKTFSDHLVINTETVHDLIVDVQSDVIQRDDESMIQIILHPYEYQSRIEKALIESEQILHTMLSHMPGIVYRALNNPDWEMLYLTEQIEELTGYSVIDFISGQQTFAGIMHPEDRQRIWDDVQRAIDTGSKFEFTYRITTKFGESRYFWEQGGVTGIDSATGFVIIEGFIVDITAQRRAEDALRASVARYRMLAENVKDVIWTMNFDNQLTYVSPASEGVCGYAPEDMVLMPFDQLWEPQSYSRLMDALDSIRKVSTVAPHFRRFELQQRCKDGAMIWVEVVINTMFDDQNELVGIVGVSRNITERREVEAAEREQRLLAETLRETINALAETLDSKTVMQRILAYVGKVVPHDAANIMLIEDDQVYVKYAMGYPIPVDEIVYNRTLPNLARMYESREPLIIPDTNNYPEWQSETKLEWIHSYVGAPIIVNGGVIGFLNLDKAEPDFYTEKHGEVLQVFANQAAVAIRNAQVYEELSDRARELSILHRSTSFLISPIQTTNSLEAVGQQIVDTVVSIFQQVDCGLMIVDRQNNRIKRMVRSGTFEVRPKHELTLDGGGLVPEAVRQARIIYAPDVRTHPLYVVGEPRSLSELVVPLIGYQGVIGALDLQSVELDAFSETDQRLLEHFAQRAATVIENAQLFQELEETNQALEQRVADRTLALRQATRRIETIFNTNNDAVVLADADGTIQQVNPAFRRLFGYPTNEELFGTNLVAYIAEVDRELVQVSLRSLGQDVATARLEICALHSGGKQFNADIVLSHVDDPVVSGVVCSFRDMTEYKEAEAALRSALERERELSELKTRFLSMASHDFRTPLTTILSSANLLKLHYDRLFDEEMPEKLSKHFHRIDSSITHMTSLLDDILIIGRVEAGKLRFEPSLSNMYKLLTSLLDDVKYMLVNQHQIVMDYDEGCPQEIIIDEKLMRQMVSNLISNAIKYSPQGGDVKLTVFCESEMIHIAVEDHGLGIPPKDQEHLFEMFHRAENVKAIQGTGLGLAIVKRAVNLHGGSVSVESVEGEGATFTLNLPLITGS